MSKNASRQKEPPVQKPPAPEPLPGAAAQADAAKRLYSLAPMIAMKAAHGVLEQFLAHDPREDGVAPVMQWYDCTIRPRKGTADFNAARDLAAFLREQPHAGAESLFLQGRKIGLHEQPANAWAQMPVAIRMAYETFHWVLRVVDEKSATAIREFEQQAARETAAGLPPPETAAASLPEHKKTLRRTGRIDARAPWAQKGITAKFRTAPRHKTPAGG